MKWLRLFTKSPLAEKKIAKYAKLAANPFAQPDIRMREMQRLIGDGSAAALRGVLRRFAVNAQGHIADEDEKKWLEDALVKCGEAAEQPLRDYIASDSKLTYALRAYTRIVGNAAAITFFLQTLQHYKPDDYRHTEAKLQIIWQLAEHAHMPEVLQGLLPFLEDHSDDMRWAMLEIVDRLPAEVSSMADLHIILARLLSSEATSERIARRVAELLLHHGWRLPTCQLQPPLDATFFIDKKGYLRRHNKKSA